MLKNKLRNNAGITLIALVITIVVMLILAGVTINLTLGENGIFTTAQQAAKNYTDAQNKELEDLNNFTNLLNNTIGNLDNGNTGNAGVTPEEPDALPENTPTTLSGTLVRKPEGKTWDETKINSYADGVGNTIPVPVGFSPITTEEGQGTKLTGFVIRDTSIDSQGNPTDTNGNEFVWVPVEGMNYTYNRYAMLESQPAWELDPTTQSMKIKYSTDSSYYYYEALPTDERDSVSTYGGYYIGRYESGVVNYDAENITKSNSSITDTTEKETWTGYTKDGDKELKLVVKSGQQVWNYITRNKAKTISEGLYNKENNNVASKLCSSYAWDTALKFMESTGSTYPTNSVGGYYGQSSPTTTGNNTAHPCNIYDMGGNTWEWTTESSSSVYYSCVLRGGTYDDSASVYPAAYRYGYSTTNADDSISFRVTLFM